MNTRKAVTVAVILMVGLPVLTHAGFSYPKLPWYEKYFSPTASATGQKTLKEYLTIL